jgi:hypothetical protein
LEWFRYKNYNIQFRLDHNNNLSVDPVLDTDIKDATTGEPIKKGEWHNTTKNYDPQKNTYNYSFKFEDLHLMLNFALTFQLTLTSEAVCVTDYLKLQLDKGDS